VGSAKLPGGGGCLHVSRNKPITRRHRSAKERDRAALHGGVARANLLRGSKFLQCEDALSWTS
jgi:hypothetical protein